MQLLLKLGFMHKQKMVEGTTSQRDRSFRVADKASSSASIELLGSPSADSACVTSVDASYFVLWPSSCRICFRCGPLDSRFNHGMKESWFVGVSVASSEPVFNKNGVSM